MLTTILMGLHCYVVCAEGMENRFLEVKLSPGNGAFTVVDKRVGCVYHPGPNSAKGVSKITIEDRNGGRGLRMGLDIHGVKVQLRLFLPENEPILILELEGDVAQPMQKGPYQSVYRYPGPLLLDSPNAYLILPANSEGFRVGVRETDFALSQKQGGPWKKNPPNHLSCSMAWHGACDMSRGFGFITILDTPHDVRTRFALCDLRGTQVLGVTHVLLSELGKWGHTRRFIYHFFDHGGYVTMAKAYRRWAKARGKIIPFRERRKNNPYIDRLVGAAQIKTSIHQPVVPLFKKLGFNKLVVFVYGGDMWREKRIPTCQEVDRAGYLAAQYNLMHYLGSTPEKRKRMEDMGLILPDDAQVKSNGKLVGGIWAKTGGKGKDVTGANLCLMKFTNGLRRSTEVKNQIKGGVHLFFHDTFGTTMPNECYSKIHPHTRRQDAKQRRESYQYIRSLQDGTMLFGTEGGADWALPGADFFEGIMSVGHNLGFGTGTGANPCLHTPAALPPKYVEFELSGRRRLPLFELVYHDVVAGSFWWNDARPERMPEMAARIDLLNMLHGTVPVWQLCGWYAEEFFYLNLDRFVETYDNVCRWAQLIGYDEMVDHKILSPDGDVQQSTFSSGYTITVNMGEKDYTTEGGTVLPPSSYLITGKPHPDLPVGRVVRIDPDWKPIDPGFEQVRVGRTSGWIAGKGVTFAHNEEEIAPASKAFEKYKARLEHMKEIGHGIVVHPEASGHFLGMCEDDFYVATRDFRVIPDFKYHFEGWLKFSKASNAEAHPAFSIEIENRDGKEIARHVTRPYDISRKDWQKLDLDFIVSDNGARGRIHLLTGSRVPIESEGYLDRIVLKGMQ